MPTMSCLLCPRPPGLRHDLARLPALGYRVRVAQVVVLAHHMWKSKLQWGALPARLCDVLFRLPYSQCKGHIPVLPAPNYFSARFQPHCRPRGFTLQPTRFYAYKLPVVYSHRVEELVSF